MQSDTIHPHSKVLNGNAPCKCILIIITIQICEFAKASLLEAMPCSFVDSTLCTLEGCLASVWP